MAREFTTFAAVVAQAKREQSETLRYLGREYKVGDFVNIVGRGVRQIVKIENGVGHLREPKTELVVPQKRPANRPWYQQHDKRKWK